MRSKAPRMRASVVSWLVSTIGTAWPGLRPRWISDFDRHLVVAQDGRDVGEHAGHVQDHEANVVAAGMGRHRRDRVVGQRRRPARRRSAARLPRASRRCRRPRPRRSGPHRRRGPRGPRRPTWSPSTTTPLNTPSTWPIGRRGRHHAGVHPLLEPVRRHPGDAQELDPVAELVGEGDVHGRDVADALDVDRVEARPPAEGQRRQQRQLVRGVDAVDVEGGVGLGVAQALRLGQHVGELAPGLAHRGQDEVAGAVEDAVDAQDPVGHQPLAAASG